MLGMSDGAESPAERRRRRLDVSLGVGGTAALVAGTALALAVHGVGALVAGSMIAGLGGIALVSLAFLLVGQSEDRDRERTPRE